MAGLGNPGEKYLITAHNIGWMAVDALARHYSVNLKIKDPSYMAEVLRLKNHQVILLKPLTYMNLSGQAVKKALSYYRLSQEQLIVAHDDKDLPFLNMKFQKNRGSAGHNGVKNIHEELKSQDYIRWRIGIGDHDVLKTFSKKQTSLLTDFLSSVNEILEYFLQEGLEKTAQRWNTKKEQA